METAIVEQFIVQFPTAAAWLIVALLGLIGTGLGLMGRKFMARLDSQDATLGQIKELLASEIGKLRELHHDIDKRVVRLESLQGAPEPKWGRRVGDHLPGEGDR